jgi:hypothetical protein
MKERSVVIGVFCYKRAGKLKRCIDALLQNPECRNMDIVFFSDGYKGENDKKGVLETRAYIDSITGFRNVIKQYRDRNYSTGPNFRTGLNYLCANYDEFIVVEDDLIVSPNYIKYLLDALEYYREDQSVFCVTGFVYPVNSSEYYYDTIVYQRFCSYGWAGWSNRFDNVVWEEAALDEMMRTRRGFKQRLNAEGYDLSRLLKKQISGKISTWDVQLQVHIAENHLKVIYPCLSKVNNIGIDDESTNTFGVNWMETPIDPGDKRDFMFCKSNLIMPDLQKQIKHPFSLTQLVRRKLINETKRITKHVKQAQ